MVAVRPAASVADRRRLAASSTTDEEMPLASHSVRVSVPDISRGPKLTLRLNPAGSNSACRPGVRPGASPWRPWPAGYAHKALG